MKTTTKIVLLMVLISIILFNRAAFAQYPVKGAPLFGVPTGVSEGLLQPLDQSTSPIWYKVNGNIVGSQPHNKLHNPANPIKGGSYVQPGALVSVNFNVNRNQANRYTIATYAIDNATGERKIFDYQSNLYNPTTPVQGNSNQQMVLVPTNCPWEIYFVKGTLVESFTASGVQDLINGPMGNPFAYDEVVPNTVPATYVAKADNLILGFSFGDGSQGAVCELCPVVNNTANNQVFTRLLEVIDLPNAEKEMLFAVINTNGTTVAPYTANGKSFELIGDILFSGITPTHTNNNTPYGMRSDYQLSPVLPNYTVGNPVIYGPKNTFVFDQRNNQNNLAFDTYQSEVVRFKVTDAEYARLSSPGNTIVPEICVELSPKHPEPHKTLVPIYCATMDFDCGTTSCPTVLDTPCEKEDCCFNYKFNGEIGGTADADEARLSFELSNLCGANINKITFTLPGSYTLGDVNPTNEFLNFTATISGTTLTYTAVGNAFDGGAGNDFDEFNYDIPYADITGGGNLVTVTIFTATEEFAQTFDLTTTQGDCGLIIVLPVELISFTGTPSSNGIDLKWETASEQNNDRFDIERSADGKNFERIGEMKGKGTTSALSGYKFTDKGAQKGLNYYRLKQVDLDGSHAYSQIINVNAEKGALAFGVQLIPNPCGGQDCSIRLQGADAGKKLTVELKDLTGRLLFSQEVPGDQASFNLPRQGAGAGVYILSARNGQEVTYQRIILQ